MQPVIAIIQLNQCIIIWCSIEP